MSNYKENENKDQKIDNPVNQIYTLLLESDIFLEKGNKDINVHSEVPYKLSDIITGIPMPENQHYWLKCEI